MARGLKAPLMAVTVVAPASDPATQKELADIHRLAEDLGAEVIRVEGRDVARALAGVASERHVTQIVLGQSARHPLRDALRGSLLDRLLAARIGADLHIVPQHKHGDEE